MIAFNAYICTYSSMYFAKMANFERELKRLGGHKTKKLKVKSSDMNLKILDMIC